MNTSEQLAYADQKIANFQVNDEPFEHYFVKDVFKPEFYREILAQLPDDDAYDWGQMTRGGERARGLFVINAANTKRLPRAQADFWQAIREWMMSSEFGEQVMSKFHEQMVERFSRPGSTGKLFAELKLIRDKVTYSLEPHTDAPNRVTTLMIYLPNDDSCKDLGTAFYRPKQAGRTCDGNTRHPFEEFELVGKAPFLPNCGLGFFKSERSFHGVEPVEEKKSQRDILTFSVRGLKENPLQKARRLVAELRGKEQNKPIMTSYL